MQQIKTYQGAIEGSINVIHIHERVETLQELCQSEKIRKSADKVLCAATRVKRGQLNLGPVNLEPRNNYFDCDNDG